MADPTPTPDKPPGPFNFHPKMAAGFTSGTLAAGIIYVLHHYAHVSLDPEAAGYIVLAIGSLAAWWAKP